MDTDRTSGGTPEIPALTSANEDTFAPATGPEPVRKLLLHEGATRVERANEHEKSDELWQGDAHDPERPEEGAIPIYFRIGSAQALVAELICGCMAHELGLPSPEVFVLSIPSGTLKTSKLAPPDKPWVCVATRDLGGETFNQLLNDNANAAIDLLRQWPELGKVAAFDEWTANIDRNMGNIIYSATTLHIIDHAEAFGGGIRDMMPLHRMTGMALQNKLSGVLGKLGAQSRNAILQDLHAWLGSTAITLDLGSVVKRAGTDEWNSPEQDMELIDFLRQRLPLTHSLLCKQLGLPQLPLQA